jgi:hypothetical protein
MDELIKVISEEVISHIKTFAVVNSTVASVSLVTIGTGVSGPGAAVGNIV